MKNILIVTTIICLTGCASTNKSEEELIYTFKFHNNVTKTYNGWQIDSKSDIQCWNEGMDLPLYGYNLKRRDNVEFIVNFEVWHTKTNKKYLVEKSPTWKTRADGDEGVAILHELEKPFEYGGYEMSIYINNKILDKKLFSIIKCNDGES